MPLTLNVGWTKKVGLTDYGSLGASCHVEVELDGGLLQHDLDGFQQQARQAYAACRQAVLDELVRELASNAQTDDVPTYSATSGRARTTARTNGRAATKGRDNSRSAQGNAANGHRATSKQLDYARQLADQIDGLGVRKLGRLVDHLYQKPLADLSSLEASGLIDVLKDLKSGELDLTDALGEVAV